MRTKSILRKLEIQYGRLCGEIYTFNAFYGNNDSASALREVAKQTFGIIQRPLIDSIIMIICRMYDPAKSRCAENLTLYQLANSLPNNNDGVKLIKLLDRQKSKMKRIRSLRNKIVGHSDLHRSSKKNNSLYRSFA